MDEQGLYQDGVSGQDFGRNFSTPMSNGLGQSIVLLTNPENELFKLELILRGLKIGSSGKVDKVGDPLLNDVGVSGVMGIVQAVVNQITVFGNLEARETNAMRDFLADALAKDLMLNRMTYDVCDYSTRSKIFFICISYAVATLSRGRGGDEKRFLSRTTHEINTSSSQGGGGGGKSIFHSLNPWNKS